MSLPDRDAVLLWAIRLCAGAAGGIVLLIAAFLALESFPALKAVGMGRLFTDASWHPSSGLYNLAPMLAGTLLATAGAVLLAAPAGIASAVFCRYFAPRWLAAPYRRVIELLAGIPSVVYGFWGLATLAPLIGRIRPPGPSLLAGVLVLAVMILPTVALVADGSLAAVPPSYLQGARALGLSRWALLRGVVFPAAKSGLFTGVILGAGRAIGETMAILMVCGNVVKVPKSLFDPVRTLTANIALEMSYASGDHRSVLFLSGLVLMGMIAALAGAAEWIGRGRTYG